MNGDTLTGAVGCAGPVLAGGYALRGDRPADQEKLIPFQNFPSDGHTWTVTVGANANVMAFVLTVFAVCQ
jgi:hypothetical protein